MISHDVPDEINENFVINNIKLIIFYNIKHI